MFMPIPPRTSRPLARATHVPVYRFAQVFVLRGRVKQSCLDLVVASDDRSPVRFATPRLGATGAVTMRRPS